VKNYTRKVNYKRDGTTRDGRQQLMPWAPGLTISTVEAGKRLGMSYDTVRAMCKCGELQAWPMRPGINGSPYRVSKDSVELFIERKLAQFDLDDDELHARLEQRGVSLPKPQKDSPARKMRQ
jgi:excisionase family DNA binding protein